MKRKDDPEWPRHTELPKVMNVREVSAYLHVHRSTIYRLLRQSQIPAFHIGSDWRFNIEAIDRWRLEQQGPHREQEWPDLPPGNFFKNS
jgi:excisionase family DNA binding protein